jgi:hypothetical protein
LHFTSFLANIDVVTVVADSFLVFPENEHISH